MRAPVHTSADQETKPNRWQFLLSPGETWDAMYEECEKAQHSIDFEQYIFRHDEVGKRFLALFHRKAQEGLRVRLILDMFGSLDTYFSADVQQLRRAGGRVHFFHALTVLQLFMPWTWFPRTHAKTMVIDSRTAYTGGVCFDARMRNWRDTQVRIVGPAAEAAQMMFDQHWRRWRMRRKPKSAGDPDFRFVFSRALRLRNPIYRELRDRIGRAQASICISTPYFVPTRGFMRLLSRAAQNGVQVRLLLSRVSDVRLADAVTRSYFTPLLAAGVQIFLYERTVLHGKVTIVDNHWATVGSMNLDYLSIFRNRETNLNIYRPDAVAELTSHFENDLQYSYEMTKKEWSAVPRLYKAFYAAGRLLRAFL